MTKHIRTIIDQSYVPIKDSDGYYINEQGSVISERGKHYYLLQPRINNKGYLRISIKFENGKRKEMLVHRIVAEAFLPKQKRKNTINHINGDKLNNSIDNIEWLTLKQNVRHAFRRGISSGRPKKEYSDELVKHLKSELSSGKKRYVVAKENGLKPGEIQRIFGKKYSNKNNLDFLAQP